MTIRFRNAFAAPSGFVTAAADSNRIKAEVSDQKGRKGGLKKSHTRLSPGPRTIAASDTKAA